MAHDPLLRNVRIWGEVSNIRVTRSGHAYFSLKDETAIIQCVCFQSALDMLSVLPQDGQNVHAAGYVSIYPRSGQMQLYVQDMEPVGMGQLFERFEVLKEELAARGYFDPLRKHVIPPHPRRIGIITSPSGAVLHDIAQVAWRRNPGQALCLAPVKVQGSGAAEEIATAIEGFNQIDDIDVIIVARGGGSLEDLWAFNEPIVAEAIFQSDTPVISAVGHETDFSIADFVADLRAPTPSAAAELSTPLIEHDQLALNALVERLQGAMRRLIDTKERQRRDWKNRLLFQRPLPQLNQQHRRIDGLAEKIDALARNALADRQRKLDTLRIRLESMGPTSLLEKGYALVRQGGNVIRSVRDIRQDTPLELRFVDGTATLELRNIQRGEKE